ncbi:MAG: cytochrome P460 family protein [Nitrospirae bacterium]|nr:cytochrome P460 family protein [Nitrospirota bacterium]
MKRIHALSCLFVLLVIIVPLVTASAGDRFALEAPNGLSFGTIRGFETWQVVAPSYRPDKNEIRMIVANRQAIDAYRRGIPENNASFPEGSILVKIAHSERKNKNFPAAIEPDLLQRIEFMVKDTKRFSETGGWGYARFVYDAKTDTFTPYGKDSVFDRECFQCHLAVRHRDFVFTGYPRR